MVLGCSVCNQPLVIRSSHIGNQDPSSLMKKFRPEKVTDTNDNFTNKANVDLTDAEIVATRCGHMFHKECLKSYLQGSFTKLNAKSPGCPMCRKPVIQSQLWPIIIRATTEEMRQIEKIKSLKTKNTELVTAIKEIRNNTQEKNSALQDARKKMFDYRVKLQGMDMESISRGNLEKLEKQQRDLEKELAAVNEQNLVLTSLVERESVYGQQIRSAQNNMDFRANDRNDPLARIVKQMTTSRVRNEGLVERSSKYVSEESKKTEKHPVIVADALERWKQMKSSILQDRHEQKDAKPLVPVKKQDLSINFVKQNIKDATKISAKSKLISHGQRVKGRSRSRGKTPVSGRPHDIKIATIGLGSEYLKLENQVRNKLK